MNYLAPSILSADFTVLGDQIKAVDEAGADMIHIDVMDGMFVPSISYGMPVIKSIRKSTTKIFDVHLMINEPIRYIKDVVDSGADMITIHVESCSDVAATLAEIRKYGVKVGITLNPDTPATAVKEYMGMVDMVLVMSVNPGFGGQKFITSAVDKIKEIRSYAIEKGYNIDIEVDGGININNLPSVLEAGANVIVAGSSVFNGDVPENVKQFKKIMNMW